MKKMIITLAVGFIIMVLLFCLAVGNPYDYYERHYARIPHVTGQINLSINGQKTPIGSDCKFTYKNNSLKQPKELILKDGRFEESFGEYGRNTMLLDLNPDFCTRNINENMSKGMKIEFWYFTTNNWYKDNTDLYIFVENISDNSCTVRLKQIVTGDDSGEIEKSFAINYDSQMDNYLEINQRFL